MTEIFSEEKQTLCQTAWGICQSMMREVECLFAESEIFSIDLQSLIPPLQKLRTTLGREPFFQTLCIAFFTGEQILAAQTSNKMLKAGELVALQDAFKGIARLMEAGVTEQKWQSSEVDHILLDFQKAATLLAVEMPKPEIPEVSSPIVAAAPAPLSAPVLTAAPEPAFQINPKLADIFFEEADELQISLQETLATWQQSPDQTETRAQMKRDLHTLKGAARTVGLGDFGGFVHELENITTALEDGKITLQPAVFQLLQEGLDFISFQIEAVRAHQPLGSADIILKKIHEMVGMPEVKVAEPKSVVSTAKDPEAVPAIQEPVMAPQEPITVSASSAPVVRVQANLIEKFSNLAGVANISRANIEEEVTEMGAYVRSVVEVVAHLQAQMKDLSVSTLKEVTTELQTLNEGMSATLEHTENWLLEQQRATDALQEGLTSIRMEPFSTVVPRLERLVRQVSRELKKEVDFKIDGVDKECDRKMLESLVPPLEHMIRNAIDHGLESSEDRLRAGKPIRGQISLSLMQTGSELILILKDDGRGIDTKKVREKAEKMGWIDPQATVTEETLLYLILKPGFTTSEQVTQISGRGVGMDVVSAGVTELGGAFSIDSQLGKGALFKIVLPFTLSLNRVLLFQVQREWYGIQLANIEGIVRIPQKECQRYFVDKEPFLYAEKTYPMMYLADRLGLPSNLPTTEILPILLLRLADKRLAVLVDSLIGTREVVIQAVGPQLRAVHSINGAAILGDGKVVFILDGLHLTQGLIPVATKKTQQLKILVVDDSATIRQTTEIFLQEHQYVTDTAEDGRDGLMKMKASPPDVVLLDLEMPQMDGYEVIGYMRALPTLKNIPIIVISSRDSEEHQSQAIRLGANCFLKKPYQEAELLATIDRLLNQPKDS